VRARVCAYVRAYVCVCVSSISHGHLEKSPSGTVRAHLLLNVHTVRWYRGAEK